MSEFDDNQPTNRSRKSYRGQRLRALVVWACTSAVGTVAHAVTMEQFVELSPDLQTGYVVGVIDLEGIDATYSFERGQCVLAWGKNSGMDFLSEWYGGHAADDPLNRTNVALILKLEARKVCGAEKVKLREAQ